MPDIKFSDMQKQAAENQFRSALDHDISSDLSRRISNAKNMDDVSNAIRSAEDRHEANRLLYSWDD